MNGPIVGLEPFLRGVVQPRQPWSAKEVLTHRLQWWLHRWAGWSRPNVRLTHVQTWFNASKDAVTVQWHLSDGRRLSYEADMLAMEAYALKAEVLDPRNPDTLQLIACSFADRELRHHATRPPWEVPGA